MYFAKAYKIESRDVEFIFDRLYVKILSWYFQHRKRTIPLLWTQLCKSNPDALAIIYGTQQVTFQQLFEQCNRFGRLAIKYRCKRGDRVALLMKSSPDLVAACIGCSFCRCICIYKLFMQDWPMSELYLSSYDRISRARSCYTRFASCNARF